MERLKTILYGLKTDINAKKVSFATKDGLTVVQVPDKNTEDSKAALGATILGASELLLTKPVITIGGAHEKIVIASVGSTYYMLVEITGEKGVSGDVEKKIIDAAGSIAAVINK